MGRRVLVVEDDAQNSYLVRFILEQSGFEVEVASDGEGAVSAAIASPPDLVLMDLLMPRMDGYEATRRIKAEPTLAGVPVVALTAYSMKGDRERVLAAGCDGYITKPIDPETFAGEVEEYL